MKTQKELPGKKVSKFWNTGLRNFLLTIGTVIILLLIIAWLNKAEAQTVGYGPAPEGRVYCSTLNPSYTQSTIVGPFPSEALALDETDPNSCASFLIANPTWRIWFGQTHYRELIFLQTTANLSWTAPTLNTDGTVYDDAAGFT